MYCTHCHKYIDASTEKCPHCGKKQATRKTNGFLSILLRIFLGIIIWTVSIAVVAMLGTALHFPDIIYAICVLIIPVVIAVIIAIPRKNSVAKDKRPFYKNCWFWIILVLFLVVVQCLSSGAKQNDVNAQITNKLSTGEKVTVEEVATLFDTHVLDSLEDYEITYSDDYIKVTVWSEVIFNRAFLAVYGDLEAIEAWNDTLDAQANFCQSLLDVVNDSGLSNVSVIVDVLNNKESALILISAIDGKIVYDYIADELNLGSPETVATENVTQTETNPATPAFSQSGSASTNASVSQTTYILNTNTMKFHYSWCSSVSEIALHNKSSFSGTRTEVAAQGYSPCGRCDP